MKNNRPSSFSERHNHESCAYEIDAAGYVSGELSTHEMKTFESHITTCDICRRRVETNRRIIARLQSAPHAEVSSNLAPIILQRIEQDEKEHRTLVVRRQRALWLAAAAALAILLCGIAGLWLQGKGPAKTLTPIAAEKANSKGTSLAHIAKDIPFVPDAEQAVDWLCRTQEPDGSWSTTRWGGDRRFQVALTGLSLLAMLGSDISTPERSAVVERAVRYLISQQDKQGAFGSAFDMAPYNHGIATLALLRAYNFRKQGDIKQSLTRAIEIICARQSQDGGWGYLQESGNPSPNLSVTLWQIEALKLADTLGWNNVHPNINRGVRWIAGMVDDRGCFGYRQTHDFPSGPQTLTAMGAMTVLDSSRYARMISPALRDAIKTKVRETASTAGSGIDFYRAYFLTTALKKMNDEASLRHLAAVRHGLQCQQEKGGAESGSWAPDNQWGNVGGRLYATTLASLSLR